MTKKGLGMVACLTVMSAAAAWATSMYSIQTKLTNGGGSVQVRSNNAQTLGGSIKYTNFTTQSAVRVMVTPDSLHKISALTQNGNTVNVGDGNSPIAVDFYKNGPTTHETQSLVATFAVKSAGNVYLKSWQLQTRNNNLGGTITTTRGTDTANTLSTSGTTVLKNYSDTTPVTVKVAASAGYSVKSVTLNGAAVALDGNGQFTINPAAGGKVNSVQAVYQKIAYTVTGGAGILPASTGTTYGGSVKLNVTPVGVNNVVTGVTVTGTADVQLTDALGNVVTAPLYVQGPVKVTLSNIKSNVSVAATYRNDLRSSDLQSCTTSCHLAASDAVKAVPSQWAGSKHYANAVSCTTCHLTMPGPQLTSANNCETCHTGPNAVAATAVQVAAWQKSSHTIAYNHFENVSCNECHNEHSLVATATDDKTDSCSKCHVRISTAKNYSLYSSNGQMRTPHGQGVPAYMGGTGGANDNASVGWPAAQTSYLTRGAICTDCHGHNNSVNKGFAEGGHGKVSNDPMNPFNHYDWSKQGNDGTRQNGSCDRCHTAAGFMKLLGATNDPAYARLNAAVAKQGTYNATIANYQANNVLICVGCHSNLDSGALRTDAAPMGNNVNGQGAGQALSAGYFALFSTATGTVDPSKTRIQVAFPGVKSSSICIPCHSGRSTAEVFKAVIDRAAAQNPANNNKPYGNYSTISTSYYQHAKNTAQTFTGQGAFDYTGNLAKVAANGHLNVKMGDSDSQGPCVGCHYSTADKTHSLEVTGFGVCASCHPTGFGQAEIDAAKANFDAGVKVLDTLIRQKFAPLQTKVQGVNLEEERAPVRFGRFGKNAGESADADTAKKAYGAWYNWQILTTYDNAAFVHNPAYARQILVDTIDYLNNPKGSYGAPNFATYIKQQQAAGALTDTEATNALAFTRDTGCNGCHMSTNDPYAGNNIIARYAQSGHATNSHGPNCQTCHATSNSGNHPDGTSTDATMAAGYKGAGAACIGCHNGVYSRNFGTVTHFSNVSTATFRNLSAAYVGPKGQGVYVCASCHFKLDPHGIGAEPNTPNGEATFHQNEAILAAWAESEHGQHSGQAWVPTVGASGHNWRASGSTVNFQQNIPATDCVRCHTAEGYAAFADSAYTTVKPINGKDTALFNTSLMCSGCHVSDASGSTTPARRVVAVQPGVIGVQTFYNISTVDKVTKQSVKARITAKFPDVGDSNICVSCHSGRLSGSALVTAQANGLSMNNSSFQNSHYMAAAGLMYMKVGFTAFVDPNTVIGTTTYGKTLTADNASTPDGISGGVTSTHRKFGTAAIIGDHGITADSGLTTGGPCVICHMGYNRNDAKGHSLLIGEDPNHDAYKQVCINCHTKEGSLAGVKNIAADGSNFESDFLEPNRVAFQDSVKLGLYYLLKNYKISYNPNSYPYFYDENKAKDAKGNMQAVTDWTRGNTLSAADALKLEGAAFNLNLFTREPAAYVHARNYVRRLVYDSIDFLDDGAINLSVVTNAKTATSATGATSGSVVDVTGKFTVGDTTYAYTDSSLNTIAAGTTEGMLYLGAWDRNSGKWNTALGKPERP